MADRGLGMSGSIKAISAVSALAGLWMMKKFRDDASKQETSMNHLGSDKSLDNSRNTGSDQYSSNSHDLDEFLRQLNQCDTLFDASTLILDQALSCVPADCGLLLLPRPGADEELDMVVQRYAQNDKQNITVSKLERLPGEQPMTDMVAKSGGVLYLGASSHDILKQSFLAKLVETDIEEILLLGLRHHTTAGVLALIICAPSTQANPQDETNPQDKTINLQDERSLQDKTTNLQDKTKLERFDSTHETLLRPICEASSSILVRLLELEAAVLTKRRYTGMMEMVQHISNANSKSDAIGTIIKSAKQMLDAQRVVIFLVDHDRRILRISRSPDQSDTVLSLDMKSIAASVVETGELINIDDAYMDDRFDPSIDANTTFRTKSILCVPIRDGSGNVVGVIEAINKQPLTRTSFVSVKQRLGQHLTRHITPLNTFDHNTNHSHNTKRKSERIQQAPMKFIQQDSMKSTERVQPEPTIQFNSDQKDTTRPNVFDTTDLKVDSTNKQDEQFNCTNSSCLHQTLNAWNFSKEDEKLLLTMAAHAGIALAKTNALAESHRQNEITHAVLEVVRGLATGEDVHTLMHHVVDASYRITKAERVTLYLVDHGRQEIWLAISKDAAGHRLPIGSGIAGFVASTGEMLHIPDAYNDSRFNSKIDKKTGFRTREVLCLPIGLMLSGERPVAVLQLINKSGNGSFDAGDIEAMQTFCLEVAVALKRKTMDAVFLRVLQDSYKQQKSTGRRIINRQHRRSSVDSVPVKSFHPNESIDAHTIRKYNHPTILPRSGSLYETSMSNYKLAHNADGAYSVEEDDEELVEVVRTSPPKSGKNNSNHITQNALQLGSFQGLTAATKAEREFQVSLLELFSDLNTTARLHSTVKFTWTTNPKSGPNFNSPLGNKGYKSKQSFRIESPILHRELTSSTSSEYSRPITVNSSHTLGDLLSPTYDVPEPKEINDEWIQGCSTDINASNSILSWDTNLLNYTHDQLLDVIRTIFSQWSLLKRFNVPEDKFQNFVQAVYKLYHNNPFHNIYHAVSVLHMTFLILVKTNATHCLTYLDTFAILIAALCHDLDHPGHNQAYEIGIRSEMALTHNDDAVLERHHAHMTFKLLSVTTQNILCNLSTEQFQHVRRVIITAILGTDMSKHFRLIDTLAQRAAEFAQNLVLSPKLISSHIHKNMVETPTLEDENDTEDEINEEEGINEDNQMNVSSDIKYNTPAYHKNLLSGRSHSTILDGSMTITSPSMISDSSCQKHRNGDINARKKLFQGARAESVGSLMNRPAVLPFDRTNDVDRLLLVETIVHTADLSGQALPTHIAQIWGAKVIEEFRLQAQKELKAGLTPVPFMANLETELQQVKLQASFVDNVVLPLWERVGDLLQHLEVCQTKNMYTLEATKRILIGSL